LYTEEKLGDRFNLEVPMLNSKEKMSVSLLTTSIGELPTKPEVSLRGEGVVGSESTIETEASPLLIFGNYSTLVSFIGTILSLFLGYYFSRRLETITNARADVSS